jgi:DNA mismatch endonuclease, patch repair protein
MPDILSKQERSDRMSRIRSRGNKTTELALVRLFRAYRITGWRRHLPMVGTPDFVFPTQKVVLFVDGCFWHGCGRHSRHVIKSGAFWVEKIERNRRRDRRVTYSLEIRGWRVMRIWEHDLATKREARLVRRLQRALLGE